MLQYRPAGRRSQECPRRRKLAALIGTAGLVGVLVTGLVLSVADLTRSGTRPDRTETVGAATPRTASSVSCASLAVSPRVAAARDELAARRMLDTGTGEMFGRVDLSTRDPGTPIVLPPSGGIGAWGVETGYPQTPQGALAQLAAIDVAVLRSASLAGVRAVLREWAAACGPSPRSGSWVKEMASLLESIGVATDGTARLDIRAIPRMGLIKGSVGTDFVVACVNFTIDVTFGGTSRTVGVDCQRMVWSGGRWLIGPGQEPAKARAVWPDTDAAIDAGFEDLLPVLPAVTSGG